MIKISLKHSGGPGLQAMVQALEPGPHVKYAKAAARTAFYRFASETRDKLRAATPVGPTGNLKRATKAKSMAGGGAKVYVSRDGSRSGKGYHSHIVEHGSKVRKTKGGANRGAMPAANYQEPILQAARASFDAEVVKRLESALRTKIASEIRKGKIW